MKQKIIKYLLTLFAFLMVGCCYQNDKLLIINKSKREIYYTTLLKSKVDSTYFSNSGGGNIEINGTSNPIVRQSISSTIDELSAEKMLYVVYFDLKEQEFVYKNINSILTNPKVKVNKYSKKELENLNWILEFNDK